MHGPYRATVITDSGVTIDLTADDVIDGDRVAWRFYSSGGGVGTLTGFTRAATFTVADLIDAGDRAVITIIGRDGPEGASRPCPASSRNGDHWGCSVCDGSGRQRARDVNATGVIVRRDDRGRMITTLGSRFNERVFKGV